MKKFALLGVFGLLALAVPAQAVKYTPAPPQHGHSCTPHKVGYNATGTLVEATLTPTGNGRYEGTIEVKLTRVNHKAVADDQTFTLTNARVLFHHGVDPAAPAPGSRVKLHGKITKLAKHCPTEGFTPTVVVTKIDIAQPKPPKV